MEYEVHGVVGEYRRELFRGERALRFYPIEA
jgi:hypothetical protein